MRFAEYLRALFRHLVAFIMGSAVMAGLTVATSGFGAQVSRATFLAVALGGGIIAASFKAWNEERDRLVVAQATERDLRAQLSARPVPDVRVVFASGDTELHVPLERPRVRTSEEKKEQLRKVRQKHPHVGSPAAVKTPWGDLNLGVLNDFREKPADDYNQELDAYYAKYEAWLADVDNHAVRLARSVEIHLEVRNAGNGPSNSVDVMVSACEGCRFVEFDDRSLRAPRKPDPPDRAAETPGFGRSAIALMREPILDIPPLASLQDPAIDVEEDRITVSTRILKPGRPVSVTAVRLLWNGDPSELRLPYEITSAELPAPTTGELTIVLTMARPALPDQT